MVEVLIIFGSSSDSKVYGKINELTPNSKAVVCSAHRSPDLLDEILNNSSAKVLVAGAGLAAHLPGVVASKTIRPVIGVPINSNFQGLDSVLSIVQMPPGIPVMCVGVDNAFEASKYAKMMLKQYESVTITGDIKNEKVKKAIEILEKFKVRYETSQEASEKNINLHFCTQTGESEEKGLTINVPLIDASKPEVSILLMQMMKKGLWVGVGRAENAALAAIEILNLNGNYTSALESYREDMKKKIFDEMKKNA